MESILDAELTWREFIDLVANDAAVEHERYIRINPDIKNEPPKLDSSGQLGSLQATTKKVLKKSRATADINRIACRLVATSFYYYSTSKPILESGDIYTITGRTISLIDPFEVLTYS
jgi:hypothetical protein